MADLRELLLSDPHVNDELIEVFEAAVRRAAQSGEPQALGELARLERVKGVLTLVGLKGPEARYGWLFDPEQAAVHGEWGQFFCAVARQTVGRRRPWPGLGEVWTDHQAGPTVDDRALPVQVWLGMDFRADL